jgi:hypothetical protein
MSRFPCHLFIFGLIVSSCSFSLRAHAGKQQSSQGQSVSQAIEPAAAYSARQDPKTGKYINPFDGMKEFEFSEVYLQLAPFTEAQWEFIKDVNPNPAEVYLIHRESGKCIPIKTYILKPPDQRPAKSFAVDQQTHYLIDVDAAIRRGFQYSSTPPPSNRGYLSIKQKAALWDSLYNAIGVFDLEPTQVTDKTLYASLKQKEKALKLLAINQFTTAVQSGDVDGAWKAVSNAVTQWEEDERSRINGNIKKTAPIHK